MAASTTHGQDEPTSRLKPGPSPRFGEHRDLTIELQALPSHQELARLWLQLEARSRHSFFTSWLWIGTWLETVGNAEQLCLLHAHRHGHTLGLAVLGICQEWRFRLLPLQTAHLNETGLAHQDAITIEYNGLLIDSAAATDGDSEAAIAQAMLSAVMERRTQLDEFQMSGLAMAWSAPPSNLRIRSNVHPAFFVDLAAINTKGQDYLSALKQRQRYVVRKAINGLAAVAELSIVEPDNWEQAQQCFELMCRLHTVHWKTKGQSGAFSSEFQQRFHSALFARAWPTGRARLLQIQHGTKLLGYFYYLCHDGRAHYYQSGVDYAQFKSTDKPGLAAHALEIEYFRADGYKVYDFMAGDHQYKRTLATDQMDLHWLLAQRRNWRTAMENFLVSAGRRWRNRKQRRALETTASINP